MNLVSLRKKAGEKKKSKFLKITPILHDVLNNRGKRKDTFEDIIWDLLLNENR